jgi:hypothetical protein
MPSYIVKPDRGEDFYVIWSTVVEAPLAFGDRAYLQTLTHHETAPERFARADERGSSAMWPSTNDPYLGYSSKGMIYEQRGWLPRGNLKAACALLGEDERADIGALLEPFEDEAEVRPA